MKILKLIGLITGLFIGGVLYLTLAYGTEMPARSGGSLEDILSTGVRVLTPTSSNIQGFRVNEITATKINADICGPVKIIEQYGVRVITPTASNTQALHINEATLTRVNAATYATTVAGGGANRTITYDAATGMWVVNTGWSTTAPSSKGYSDYLKLRKYSDDVPLNVIPPPSMVSDAYVYALPYVRQVSPTSGSKEWGNISQYSNVYYTTNACLSEITMTANPTNMGWYFSIAGQLTRTNVVFITPTNLTSINGHFGQALAISPTARVDFICDRIGNLQTKDVSGTWGTHFNFIKWPHHRF